MNRHLRRLVLVLLTAGLLPAAASAQNGSWSQSGTGSVWSWGDPTNWTGGTVADGANNTATFATAGLSSGVLISLDQNPNGGPRTVGSLVFDNPTNTFGWTIQGANTLTLSNSGGPSIAVNNANITATITAPLAGSFNKVGPGTLALSADNTGLTGGVTVTAGVLAVATNGSANPLGPGAVTLAGGTLRLGDGDRGYNQRMVVPVGTTFATSGITATMDGGTALTGYTWYAKGQNTAQPTTGLPMGSSVNSAFNGNTYTMPVANTTSMNTLLMDATRPTGRLFLVTPSGQQTIWFLTSSANPGSTPPTVTATLHYTDGTPDATGLSFISPDWLGNTNVGVGQAGRISAAGYAAGGSLFDESITNPNPGHTIGSIDLSWAAGSNAGAETAVFALSGGPSIPIPLAANTPQTFANNVTVTADSTIDVRTSATAAVGNVSIGPNTLTVTGSGAVTLPTLKVGNVTMTTGTLAPASGVTVLFNGSAVSGGFLAGSGAFATAGNGGQFTNVTAQPSATINANTGQDRFTNFTNNGSINVAANINQASPVTFNGFTNAAGGSITVGANTFVNAANFQSNGTLTLAPGTNSGAGLVTELINTGTTTLNFNAGSQTYVSLPNHTANFDAGVDLRGHNLVVTGGLFVNFGFVVDSSPAGNGVIVADSGGLYIGNSGSVVVTQNGGKYQAGYPTGGALGPSVFGVGGVNNYVFQIYDAAPGTGKIAWGLDQPGALNWTATPANPLTVHLKTILTPTGFGPDGAPGLMANFDPTKPYAWAAIDWTGTYSGPTDPAILAADTVFDTTGVMNPFTGTFGWQVNVASKTLSLTYTPTGVPEPGTLSVTVLAGLGIGWFARRRQSTPGACSWFGAF